MSVSLVLNTNFCVVRGPVGSQFALFVVLLEVSWTVWPKLHNLKHVCLLTGVV